MADILLQPIHLMQDAVLTDGQLNTAYLVVSQPSINSETFLSYKISMEKIKNLATGSIGDTLENKISAELNKFANTLSGTVSSALSNVLPASKLVVTDSRSKLSTHNNFNIDLLSCLNGCVGSIQATFDLISSKIDDVNADLASKYNSLTGDIGAVDNKAATITSDILPTLSNALSTGIDISGNYLENKILTVKIDVDVIKENYVNKSDNDEQHTNISTSILAIVAEVSTLLSTAIRALSAEFIDKARSLQVDILSNANNIAFILDNLNIGINMYETIYANGSWTYNLIKDKHDNASLGYLFNIDDPEDDSRNESVLLLSLGTPLIDDDELEIASISAVLGCSLNAPANEVLEDVNNLEINVDIDTGTLSIRIDGMQQNVKAEQFIFLNIN